ncbi:flocculation protein FLO11-like isoform X3 [Pomacea canaliculata]|uniref:flocculation protein FLO11-like isoform X3 n=1 Tax=Pomacea canaliculata TaxID=400727 RepID=UPI000D730DC0|nr:flocculation protein FLO11-like isoform X3 [Pomacea canaliculata]
MDHAVCPVDILIDLSDPIDDKNSLIEDDKENTPLIRITDSVELIRRSSFPLSQPSKFEEHVFQDVTDRIEQKDTSPEVRLIEEEEFDFDLPVSSPERRDGGDKAVDGDEEDEVFIGPIGFMEKCIAAGVAEEVIKPLSPLRPDQVAEIAKEAFLVAHRIVNMTVITPSPQKSCSPKTVTNFRPVSLFGRKTHTLLNKYQETNDHSKGDSQDLNGSSTSPHFGHIRQETFTKELPVEELVKFKKEQSNSIAVDDDAKNSETESSASTVKSHPPANKLQLASSKLLRYNRSQINLAKVDKQLSSSSAVRSKEEEENIQTESTIRRSLQPPKMPSTLPMRGLRLAGPSQKSAVNTSVQQGQKAQDSLFALPRQQAPVMDSSTGMSKGPATKPQLIQPGHLQRRNLAQNLNKTTRLVAAGPLKATTQAASKKGETVERPNNLMLPQGNTQCPEMPTGIENNARPKLLSVTNIITPVKSSSSSSSVCDSTPGSVTNKRLSMLPTPSKSKGSSVSSLPLPSPLSLRSSNSSNLSFRSVPSSSDAGDSPMLDPKKTVKNRRLSGVKGSCTSSEVEGPSPLAFQPRKPLVQNTPEVPRRIPSKWSPVVRSKPAALDEQVSMCTKRLLNK